MKKIIENSWFIILSLVIIILAGLLRIYRITSFPPAPYWEEVALGYDAYSLAQTGSDHHGNFLPIVAIESFGDWKPSGYFYALIPFIKIFGLSVWTVRLPSFLSGVLIVAGMGVLLNLFLSQYQINLTSKKITSLIGMAVTAISPWAVQFSRAGWEVNLATCLILWGIISCLSYIFNQNQSRKWRFITGAVLLILSMYTYHAARMIVPFLSLGLVYLWSSRSTFKQWFINNYKFLFGLGVICLFLLLPLITSLGKKTTSQRFAETSIFSNVEIIKESNLRKERAHYSFVSKILFHRYLLFSREIVLNYFKHFDLNFLFISGDQNPRHSVQYLGQLYHIEFVFIFFGLYWLIRNWRQQNGFFLFWLLIGILPAAITNASPHALRILPTLPVWMLLITLGIFQISNVWKKTSWVIFLALVISTAYLAELTMFWRFYSRVYPLNYEHEWQYGYEQMITEFEKYYQQDSSLINQYITREYGRPVMYYFFFTKTSPLLVQSFESTAQQDQGELLEYQQLKFINNINNGINTPALVAASPDQFNTYKNLNSDKQINILNVIDNLKNQPVWIIFSVK